MRHHDTYANHSNTANGAGYGLTLLWAVGLGMLAHDWLGDTNSALWALMVVDTWKWYGFHMVIFLAGLQTIPAELYEARAE